MVEYLKREAFYTHISEVTFSTFYFTELFCEEFSSLTSLHYSYFVFYYAGKVTADYSDEREERYMKWYYK